MIPKKNLPLLLNLAYAGYNRAIKDNPGFPGDFSPSRNPGGELVTHCNQFIQYVCNGFGYDALNGMTANDMIKFMDSYEHGWISPTGDDVVQTHANSGVIVIAGYVNPTGHGHVCLVIPGILEYSSSFGRSVPKVVNVGKDVFFGKRLSYAFQAEEMPKYFALAGMI